MVAASVDTLRHGQQGIDLAFFSWPAFSSSWMSARSFFLGMHPPGPATELGRQAIQVAAWRDPSLFVRHQLHFSVTRRFAFLAILSAILFGAWLVSVQPFVSPIPSKPPVVDQVRLQEIVRHLSVGLYPRSVDQATKLTAAGMYIRDAFVAAGATVELQDVIVEGESFFNVIARFGPSQGSLIVVGAHYDSHAHLSASSRNREPYSRDTHTPGADDNASGVAGLVELAFLLSKVQLQQPVELVAYTLEEPPHFRTEHMGSAWHAKSLKAAQRNVALMISLEMIGYFTDAPDSQTFPLPGMGALYSTRGDFISIVARPQDWSPTRSLKAAMLGASDLPVRSINAVSAIAGIDFSDHRSYWAEGIPAVMVTDTAFYRNAEYHRAGDTFERLDYARMAKVVQGVYSFITNQHH